MTVSEGVENWEHQVGLTLSEHQLLPKKMVVWKVPSDVLNACLDSSMDKDEYEKKRDQNIIDFTRKKYEDMGIIILKEYNEYLYHVRLPKVWSIYPHHWSYVWSYLSKDNAIVGRINHPAKFSETKGYDIEFVEDGVNNDR